MSDDTNTLDRRSVLKTLGATAAVGGGLAAVTGGATAQSPHGITDESALLAAFEEHGGALLETLVAEGFVDDDFAFADLAVELDPAVSGLDPDATDRLAGVSIVKREGTTTAFGAVSTSSATHDIALYVQPARAKAYARVTPKSGGDTLNVSGDGVTPEGCLGSRCDRDVQCSTCYVQTEYLSCDAQCQNCDVYDPTARAVTATPARAVTAAGTTASRGCRPPGSRASSQFTRETPSRGRRAVGE